MAKLPISLKMRLKEQPFLGLISLFKIFEVELLSSVILRACYEFSFLALSNISFGRPLAKLLSMLQTVPRTIYDLVIILNLLS